MLADDIEADVVCLNETNNTNFRLVNYNCAGKTKLDKKTLGTGTMTFVKTNHWYKTLREESKPKSGEIVEVQTPMATITNLYGYGRGDMKLTNLERKEPHVIIGDFNAHHEDYLLSNHTDSMGKELELLLDQNNYSLLNDSRPTHNRGGILDVCLTNETLAKQFSDFDVGPNLGSDHNSILVSFTTEDFKVKSTAIRKINWQKYREIQLQELKDNQLWPPTPCWERDALNETAKRIEKLIDKCKTLSQETTSSIKTSATMRALLRGKNQLRRKKTQLKRDRQTDSDEYKRLSKELNFTRKKISKLRKQERRAGEQTNKEIQPG